MPAWICTTCGLEYPDTPAPPVDDCAICADERQYFLHGGQQWTTLENLQQDRTATVEKLEPDLYGIMIEPKVGIGHRPLLVRTPNGNVLWDAPGYFDDDLAARIRDLGGIAAIASSHPHLTGLSPTWSQAFGGVPVWYGADDRRWVRTPSDAIRFWQGTQVVLPGITLVQCGGHFPGSAVLHWAMGADGRGVAFSGDTFMVVADREHVTFMRSFPNMIPLPQRSVQKIVDALAPWPFDRAYSGFTPGLLDGRADEKVRESAARYIQWIRDDVRDPDERVD
ncbi:MAG TPA: hypothetical protein VD767_08125 [Thermomicrobiales bacterium]|nr:hypothetical protein [Thermomicrobiales bacterium]